MAHDITVVVDEGNFEFFMDGVEIYVAGSKREALRFISSLAYASQREALKTAVGV